MIGTRLAHYEITAHVGSGGMGDVYQATDSKLGRSVAVKCLPEAFAHDADRVARFQREARVLASLNHSNIAVIYGLEESGERHFLVMEFVSGETLADRIARGPIPMDEALEIARQITDALEAAHEKGILHRDLKPANIKITGDGKVKVLDFGLAKILGDDSYNPALSNSPTMMSGASLPGVILGTASYMSPEQSRGKVLDKRSDVWAFGIVLFEMLTGRKVFSGETATDVIGAIAHKDPDWEALPAETPEAIRRLLQRCLTKDVQHRLRDIADARLEIETAIAEPSATRPLAVPPKNHGVLYLSFACLLLLAALSLDFAYRRPALNSEVFWLSIPLPTDKSGDEFGAAVSPDGKSVAFGLRDADGNTTLWIREFSAQSARMIPGVENLDDLFWSPDGNWIGFYSNLKLQKVKATGGPPQKLADIYNPRGATWSKDGVILFAPSADAGLYRVSDSGGGTTQVPTAPNATRMTYPTFLPDGQHFLYRNLHDHEWWLNVGSLDGKSDLPLLKAASHAEYSNGFLLFGKEGGVWAQPFDPARLALSGSPIRIIDATADGNDYGFSAAGTTLAITGQDFLRSSQLTWFDANGKKLNVVGEGGRLTGFSVSPDHSRAVFEKCGSPNIDGCDAWTIDLKSGYSTPLTTLGLGDDATTPLWLPTGDRILFLDLNSSALQIVPATGGTGEQWPSAQGWPSSISPDGRFLLLQVDNSATKRDLMLIPLAGDHQPAPYLHSPFNEFQARFAPDGKSVAYVSDESGEFEVYVRHFPESGNVVRISQHWSGWPEWSEDGKQLYFLTRDPGDGKLWVMVADMASAGSQPRKLFEAPPIVPDGGRSQYAVVDKGNRFIFNVILPGTTPRSITVGVNWLASLKH